MNLRMEAHTLMKTDLVEKIQAKIVTVNRTSESMIQMMNQDWLKSKNNTNNLRGKYDKENRAKYHWSLLRRFVNKSFKKNY